MDVPKSVYAILDVTNDTIIWNYYGGAYRDLRIVSNKLKKLRKKKPYNKYELICWNLWRSIPAK